MLRPLTRSPNADQLFDRVYHGLRAAWEPSLSASFRKKLDQPMCPESLDHLLALQVPWCEAPLPASVAEFLGLDGPVEQYVVHLAGAPTVKPCLTYFLRTDGDDHIEGYLLPDDCVMARSYFADEDEQVGWRVYQLHLVPIVF